MKFFTFIFLITTFQLVSQEKYIVSPNNEYHGTNVPQKKRYLVTPNQEVIPIDERSSARAIMQARIQDAERAHSGACSGEILDGFHPTMFQTPYSNFGSNHKDVLGEWFVATYTGTIDTIFWQVLGLVGAQDSSLFLRVHKSVIGPNFGPGVRPGPYNPPCQNWGYWHNTNDLDNGIAAFPEDATDTTWISTINGSVPSVPPFAEELWGLGGYQVYLHAADASQPIGRQHSVATAELSPLHVTAGDVFFISFTVNGPQGHIDDDRTEFLTGQARATDAGFEDFYPSRNWKFYEHDSGPSNCAGIPTERVKRGWVARGGFTSDTLDVAAYLFWFSVTSEDNVPPELISSDPLGPTMSTEPRVVSVSLQDCDYADPADAGIDVAYLNYSITNVQDGSTFNGTVTLNPLGGDLFEAEIPGFPAWTSVSYSITAIDKKGLTVTFPQGTYLISSLKNNYFQVEISDTTLPEDIQYTGTEIPSEAFFSPPDEGNLNPKDNGTSGPFPLGSPFILYGKEYNYVWVGVNGAICLSKNATDTLDVNANGFYTTGFTFPDNALPQNNMRDSADDGYFPTPFIAGFWNDFYYGDTIGSIFPPQWGHIFYKDDSCKFIVQWDSLKGPETPLDPLYYPSKFRIILNSCNGTITFQYDDVGDFGFDTTALVGLQVDSIDYLGTAPWIYINKNGSPYATRPKNGRSIKIIQNMVHYVSDKWNLVALTCIPVGNNTAVTNLFPTIKSKAFAFSNTDLHRGYQPVDSLVAGYCYWMKFDGSQVVGYPCYPITTLCTAVAVDWNLVPSIDCIVPTSSVEGAVVAGASWFGYNNGYHQSVALIPGSCYWVKASGNGEICMNCSSFSFAKTGEKNNENALSTLNQFTISDAGGGKQTLYLGENNKLKKPISAYELPPTPLEGLFDVRFTSQRMVEVFPDAGENKTYTIRLQSSSYPVTFKWETVHTEGRVMKLQYASDGKTRTATLNGNGSVNITDPEVTQLTITVSGEQSLPEKFELMQNYPNPFNPSTVIRYALPTESNVTLIIYDILGREVATLIDGMQTAGYKSIEWNASEFPSGVYLYRITAGTYTEEKRMLIIK